MSAWDEAREAELRATAEDVPPSFRGEWFAASGSVYTERGRHRCVDLFADAHAAGVAEHVAQWSPVVAIAALDEIACLRAEIERLREDAAMACIEPADHCDCAGCRYAREKNGGQP